MAIIDDLVSYWAMDETGGSADRVDAHGALDLSVVNTVTDRAGVQGRALDAPGEATSGHVEHGDHVDLRIASASATFALWVAFDAVPGASGGIFGKGDDSDGEYVCTYDNSTQFIRFGGFTSAGFGGSASAEVAEAIAANGAYHFVVGWFDSAAQQWGCRVDNFAPVTAAAGSSTVYSAVGTSFKTPTNNIFRVEIEGGIDEFGFWRRVLTSTELDWLYNSGAGRTYSDIVAGMSGTGAKIIFRNRAYV